MLKYIKHNMETIDGVSIYPIISFLIFFSIFVGAVVYIYTRSRTEIDEISHLPLESSNPNDHEKTE